VLKKLFALSMTLTMTACLDSAPPDTRAPTSTSASELAGGAGTCRYICTRIVGGNEWQLDNTDPNNPPNRCQGNNACTAPNPLTCATPGLVLNPACSAQVVIDD
jgi:hypothetical protein